MNPKKEAILRKVLDILSQSEHEQKLTLSHIAESLDMGKSTLYEYFPHKDAMICDAMFLVLDENLLNLTKPLDEACDFEEALSSYIERSFHLANENKLIENMMQNVDVARVGAQYKAKIDKKLVEFYAELQSYLDELFAIGYKESVINKPFEGMERLTVESLLLGAFIMVQHPFSKLDKSGFTHHLYQTILTLLN